MKGWEIDNLIGEITHYNIKDYHPDYIKKLRILKGALNTFFEEEA